MKMAEIELNRILPIIPDHLRTENPPGPLARVVYQNGTGELIETSINLYEIERVPPVSELTEELEELRERRRGIPHLVVETARKKRKHGGRQVPKGKRRKRTTAIQKEEETLLHGISAAEQRIEALTGELSELVQRSDPFAPPKIHLDHEVLEVEGQLLSEAGQKWWEFVRREGLDGPWGLVQIPERRNGDFFILEEYFQAKLERERALREAGPTERKLAEAQLEETIREIGRMGEDEFNTIRGYITQINLQVRRLIDFGNS